MGYFTMLSLSEHIVFALPMFPVAVLVAISIATGLLSFQLGSRAAMKATPPIPPPGTSAEEINKIRTQVQAYGRHSQRMVLIFSMLSVVAGAASAYAGLYFFAVVLFAIGLSGIFGVFLPSDIFLAPRSIMLWYAFGTISAAFALGFGNAKNVLTSPSAKDVIILAQEELRVNIIRSGERGILFYEPRMKKIAFVMWTDVKRITSVVTGP